MFGKFTRAAEEVLQIARAKATEYGHGYIGTEHILLGLIFEEDSIAARVLEMQEISYEDVIDRIEQVVEKNAIASKEIIDYTPRTKRMIEESQKIAKRMNANSVGTEHLLLAIIQESSSLAVKILVSLDADIMQINEDILKMSYALEEDRELEKAYVSSDDYQRASEANTFEKYTTDLTELAKRGELDPVIGRDKEIERVIQILSRRTKNNPCLIGEPGVGKTAVVEGLAQKIIEDDVPEILREKRVLTLDISSMVAGTKYRGEFESRIKKVIEELKANKEIILFIDELHTIIGAGAAEGSLDAANILKPSLARCEIQVIGATTIEEYRKHIEKDAALERRFQPVKVEEPTVLHTIEILKGLRDRYEAHHEVEILDSAISAAATLSNRYLTDRFLPDKAIDLLDEAASKVKLKSLTKPKTIKDIELKIERLNEEKETLIKLEEYEKAGELKKKQTQLKTKLEKENEKWKKNKTEKIYIVSEKEIGLVVEDWTGVPVTKLEAEESMRLTKLEELLHERIVGQEEAIKSVSTAVRRGRVGLKDPKRPIGSFLFLGPTGVGKTELTKSLAEVMFGDEKFMIRIDMSEFMEKHTTSKLIGSPPGYVGYEEGGQLTELIRRKPYSVVLFDEIEKAHPDVFNVLLQILDDGHITDSQGRKVDFKNTVIIMTSNIGARDITENKTLGFSKNQSSEVEYKDMKKNVMGRLKENFKPEFINRIDEIVVFHPLSKENIRAIVDILASELVKKAKENVKINLKLTDEVKDYIAKEGYDPIYGARPLKRAIQTKLEDRMAEKILDGTIKENSNVTLDIVSGEVDFKVKTSSKKKIEE